MKKSLLVFATMLTFAMLTLFLCGCVANKDADDIDYGDTFSKAQEIAVISSDTQQVIETITDAEEIANFTLALDADQWSLSSLPSNASELGSFGFSQQETVKLFDINPDKSLYDVATIVLYEGGYIDVEIVNLDWFNVTFAVSEDTYNYLKAYFE